MGDKTGISWTDATWNPVRGCSRVSEGCRNCYAERVAARFSGPGKPYEGLATLRRARRQTGPTGELTQPVLSRSAWTGEVRFVAEHLADPLLWKRPRRIFVNSMSDLFNEKLTNEQIAAVFGVMATAPQHTFQILTKRAKRMREWFAWAARLTLDDLHGYAYRAVLTGHDATRLKRGTTWPLPNAWIGVSVENQAAADERIPELLATPAAVRFLSCEPLLGPVHLTLHGSWIRGWDEDWKYDTLNGCEWASPHSEVENGSSTSLDWVIAGCESGPGARRCDVAWLRSLRDQCLEAGVPLWLKQAVMSADTMDASITFGPGAKRKAGGLIELPYLDGVQHCNFPGVKPSAAAGAIVAMAISDLRSWDPADLLAAQVSL